MTLDPDGPAPHIFPHPREAIRAWWAHRHGKGLSRPGTGDVRGKGPTPDDCLRVGRLLMSDQGLNLTKPQVRRLVEYAHGIRGRTDDKQTESLVRRVERWMRKLEIVAKPPPRFSRYVDQWVDDDGLTQKVTYCVDFS